MSSSFIYVNQNKQNRTHFILLLWLFELSPFAYVQNFKTSLCSFLLLILKLPGFSLQSHSAALWFYLFTTLDMCDNIPGEKFILLNMQTFWYLEEAAM